MAQYPEKEPTEPTKAEAIISEMRREREEENEQEAAKARRRKKMFSAGIYSALAGVLIASGATITPFCTRYHECRNQMARVGDLSSEITLLTQARDNTIDLFKGKTLTDMINIYQPAIVSREEEIKTLESNPEYQAKKKFLYYLSAGKIGGAVLGYAGLVTVAINRKR